MKKEVEMMEGIERGRRNQWVFLDKHCVPKGRQDPEYPRCPLQDSLHGPVLPDKPVLVLVGTFRKLQAHAVGAVGGRLHAKHLHGIAVE